MRLVLEKLFNLKANATTARTEILAGLTTFMTMAYILSVNPGILSGAGLDFYSVFLATALAAGIFTIALGLFVNFPVALAPGMGLNAYFASVVITTKATNAPITPEMALTAVFISGIIFLILTVTQVRQILITAVPDSLKSAITVGIGLFIAIIGMKNSGLLTVAVENVVTDIPKGIFTDVLGFETVFHMGSLSSPSVYLTLIGLLLIGVLMVLRIPGAILWGMLGTTIVAIATGDVSVSAAFKDAQWIPDFTKLSVANFDFAGVWETGIISVIVTFTFVELFDTFGTMVGSATRAGIMDNAEEGKKRVGKAMFVDAAAVSGGALLGTSTVTAYVESAAGIAQGGRTGLTAVSTGVAFLLSLFLFPIISLIPGAATSAALILVGVLMVQSIKNIDFTDMIHAIPAFLTITIMPFTYNIANGISIGVLSYVVLAAVGNISGKSNTKIHWLMWVLAVLIILRYGLVGSQG